MSKVLAALNDNHWFAIAAVLLIFIAVYFTGCQSTVPSLLDPTIKVTRGELEAEIDGFIAKADARIADLDRQDEIRRMLLDKAAIWATTGTINWQGLLNTAISGLAIGSALDQRRKYKNIRQQLTTKNAASNQPTT